MIGTTASNHAPATPPSMLIRGGTIIDGTGKPGAPGDVWLLQGRIAEIAPAGSLSTDDVDVVVDAGGLVVSPGFIDVHSHADNAPFLEDVDFSKLSQGVTSEVTGNCGHTFAPASPEHVDAIEMLTSRLFPRLGIGWETTAQFFEVADRLGHPTNTIPLVGHHAVRASVLGADDRRPDADQLRRMERHVDEALAAGAFGFSSGLIYPPGMFAETGELVALVKRLPPTGVYASHIRGEGDQVAESLDEALTVAGRARRQLQVSHLKAAGRKVWGVLPSLLSRLDEANAAGITNHHDVYPYLANSTMLTACLPPWFQDGGNEGVLRRLRDPQALARAEADILADDGTWENWVAGSGWENVLLASTADHRFEGLTLDKVAAHKRTSPFAALVELLLDNELQVTMSVFAMNADDVDAAITHPRAVIGSDGLPPGTGGKPHPRLFGTFTRVLADYVRERGLLSLPEAIAKMTSMPATVFGLKDRGVLRTGAAADVVVFDPETVRDAATYTDPFQHSAGIHWVIVNGVPVMERGTLSPVRAGRRLRPPHLSSHSYQ